MRSNLIGCRTVLSADARARVLGYASTLLALLLVSVSVSTSAIAAPASISYASAVVQADPPTFETDAEKLLNGPILDPAADNVPFFVTTEATFGNFGAPVTYDPTLLRDLVGPGYLSADFVAIDLNGYGGVSGGGAFEDSFWTFTDGVHIVTYLHHLFDTPSVHVVGNNERLSRGDTYNSLFGASAPSNMDIGVIMFNLASFGIDTSSPDFKVTLSGGSTTGGTGVPEVILLGKLSLVPAPASVWLFGVGLFGLIGIARRKVA